MQPQWQAPGGRIEGGMIPSAPVGTAEKRVDGPAKVTGAAAYSGDLRLPDMAYAALVQTTIAHGRIMAIDSEAACKLAGVLAVFTEACFAPGLRAIQPPPEKFTESFSAERRAPLSDNVVHYAGQHAAIVIAASYEIAKEAASLVRIEYDRLPAALTLEPGLPGSYAPDHFATNSLEKLNSVRGAAG